MTDSWWTHRGADIEPGPVFQQQATAVTVTAGGRQVEGGPALAVSMIGVTSPLQQQLQTTARQKYTHQKGLKTL